MAWARSPLRGRVHVAWLIYVPVRRSSPGRGGSTLTAAPSRSPERADGPMIKCSPSFRPTESEIFSPHTFPVRRRLASRTTTRLRLLAQFVGLQRTHNSARARGGALPACGSRTIVPFRHHRPHGRSWPNGDDEHVARAVVISAVPLIPPALREFPVHVGSPEGFACDGPAAASLSLNRAVPLSVTPRERHARHRVVVIFAFCPTYARISVSSTRLPPQSRTFGDGEETVPALSSCRHHVRPLRFPS